MRMLNHETNWIRVLAALVTMTFCGAASAQVPNGAWAISDQDELGTTAIVVAENRVFAATIDAVCVPFAGEASTTGSAIQAEADHPARVTGKKDSASIEQGEKENAGTIRLITGSGVRQNTTVISCKKLEIEASVNTKKAPSTGKFKVKASDCDCPLNVEGTCDDFLDQVMVLQTDCSTKKSIKFDFSEKKEVVKKITISGKGDATPLE
jgi:hypothetical protein